MSIVGHVFSNILRKISRITIYAEGAFRKQKQKNNVEL
jgi:hypothetical protein